MVVGGGAAAAFCGESGEKRRGEDERGREWAERAKRERLNGPRRTAQGQAWSFAMPLIHVADLASLAGVPRERFW